MPMITKLVGVVIYCEELSSINSHAHQLGGLWGHVNTLYLYLTQSRYKKYINHVTHRLSWAGNSIFHRKSEIFIISGNTGINCILMHKCFESSKIVLINMVKCLMISAKLATLCLPKLKVFCNKGYDAIISVCNVTNKILPRDSNYIVDVVMWPKFANFSISMRAVIITSILKEFDQKNQFFEGCCWGVEVQ